VNSDAKRLTTNTDLHLSRNSPVTVDSTTFKRQSTLLPHMTTKQTEAHQPLGIYPHPRSLHALLTCSDDAPEPISVMLSNGK